MAHVSGALDGALADATLISRVTIWLFSRLAFVYLAFVIFAMVSQAQTQDGGAPLTPERGVKAAYLYKFAGYVDWPAGTFPRADTPISISVAGDDQLADALEQYVSSRTVDDRPLIVKKMKADESLDGIHILFIARGESARLRTLGKSPGPTLVVTESEGTLSQGSAINFLISGGRVRFEVALENAEKRHLKLGSGLLRVAQNVRGGAP
jgi:hypothetical protein